MQIFRSVVDHKRRVREGEKEEKSWARRVGMASQDSHRSIIESQGNQMENKDYWAGKMLARGCRDSPKEVLRLLRVCTGFSALVKKEEEAAHS